MNFPESNRELAENKLILLYIFEKLGISLSNLQITKLVLENKLMNYFFLQQFLNELCEAGFLSTGQEEGKALYSITQNGKQTLGFFTGHIPAGIKARIDSTISSIKKSIRNETLIHADFKPESENEFVVELRVREDSFTLIDLKIAAGTKSDARLICDNWLKHSQSIYSEIIESLTKQRDKT